MSIKRRLAVPFLAATTLLVPISHAASGSRPVMQDQDQQNKPELITRVYSLRPLVAEARQSAAADAVGWLVLGDLAVPPGDAPGLGGIGGAGQGSGKADEVVGQVMGIITSTVAPDSWQDNGGSGTITYLPTNSRLIVTHTADVHARVSNLIAELQDRQVVSVRGRLVRMPEADVEQNTQVIDGVAVWQADPADLPVLAQVRFSGFDGEAQHVASGRSVGYFQSVTPIVAANAVGYQPSTSELQTGLVLRATPILDVNGASATIQVNAQYILLDEKQAVAEHWQLEPAFDGAHSFLWLLAQTEKATGAEPGHLTARLAPTTQPGAAGEEAAPEAGYWLTMRAAPGGSAPVLPDRLSVQRRVLETSLRVPVGKWVLVGTMGASADGQPTNEDPLHLLIRIDAGGERK